ncbi:MAG: hypothetical protein Q9174_001336 [Haloplaca sp. 1 TL-2023]
MAGTRSSARQKAAAANSSSPTSSQGQSALDQSNATGAKRKAGSNKSSPASKRGRKGAKKEQTTIEDSMAIQPAEDDTKDSEMKDVPQEASTEASTAAGADTGDPSPADDKSIEKPKEGQPEADKEQANGSSGEQGLKGISSEKIDTKQDDPEKPDSANTNNKEDAVEESSKRDESTPSSILEKGIIYFFFRGRVGINEPSEVGDIARSYIVLRPLPHGAKLGDGPIADAGHNRMLALPKKVLPVSPKDRFMTFVEKTNTSIEDIKTTLSSSDYMTKTAGSRHTPAAAPIGEGVYAITQTGRDTHLAYILTIPSNVDEVQEGVGLKQRGSYATSAKNPTASAPANASLPKSAEYPQEILDEFRGRGWMPLTPKLLEYENTQFLLIGHNEGALEKATAPQPDDVEQNKEAPKEEMEKLEHEDDLRVEHLKGNDTVFEDLGMSSREYPKLQTTW